MLIVIIIALLVIIAVGVLLISKPGQEVLYFIVRWFLIGGFCFALLFGLFFLLSGEHDYTKILQSAVGFIFLFLVGLTSSLLGETGQPQNKDISIKKLEKVLPVLSIVIFSILLYIIIKG